MVECYTCGGEHFARDCPQGGGKGKGKGGGGGKGGGLRSANVLFPTPRDIKYSQYREVLKY